MKCSDCKIRLTIRGLEIEYCPLHGEADKMLEALDEMSKLIKTGDMVRDTSCDDDSEYFFKQGGAIYSAVSKMNSSITKAKK